MNATSHPSVFFALGYGILTGLTPCVFPMVPITLAIFGVKAGTPRSRAIALALAYDAGIALMFGSLGTIAGATNKMFGAALSNPWVVWPVFIFFIAMGLSMFGAFEVALPHGLQQRLSRVGGKGFAGAFLMGLVGGIIAAPCTGPPLAILLTYVATHADARWGFILLATYGAGVGVPLMFLSIGVMSLRPGAWMEWIKSLFGILFFVAALFYLKNVVPPLAHFASGQPAFGITMLLMIAVGVAIGAIHASFHGPAGERARKTAAVGLLIVGLFGGINYVLTPKIEPGHELAWLSDEPAAVAEARAAGRPIIVDFMADWCVPCKEFDVRVFSRPDVAREMRRFTLLRVDLSKGDDDPQIAAIKKKYQADTLPAVRIVTADGAILARTDELIAADRFREKLLTALPAN